MPGAAGLLRSPAARVRFLAGQRRVAEAETLPAWRPRPVAPRQSRRSGSLGSLRLVRGRVRARAFSLPCSGSTPPPRPWCPLSWQPPAHLVAAVSPERLRCPEWSPWARAGWPASAGLRALSAGGTGRLRRGKLACPRRAPPSGGSQIPPRAAGRRARPGMAPGL